MFFRRGKTETKMARICPRCGAFHIERHYEVEVLEDLGMTLKTKTTPYFYCKDCGLTWHENPYVSIKEKFGYRVCKKDKWYDIMYM